MKKLIFFVTTGTLFATLFSGCGNSRIQNTESAPTAATVTTETQTSTTATKAKTTVVVTTTAVISGSKSTPKNTQSQSTSVTTVDTAGGADEPKIAIEPKIEQSEDTVEVRLGSGDGNSIPAVIDPSMNQEQPANNSSESIDYNQDIYDKIGVKVTLTGSNEEQARQYYEACKAAYPSLPWYNNGNSAGVSISSLQEESSVDVWSMTHEEVDALINERLAGRDYHDLNLEELYSLLDLAGPTDFGMEIYGYFTDLTHRDFNFGGYHVW